METRILEGLPLDYKKILRANAPTAFAKNEIEYAIEFDEDIIMWDFEWATMATALNRKLHQKGARNKDKIEFLIKRITEVL